MEELIAEAASRGLSDCVEILSREPLPHPLPPTAGLAAPPSSDPISALDQLRRCGLDPRLVPVFLDWLKHRPIEKGLFAWDVLANSLLPTESELTETLRSAARVVRDILPERGRRYVVAKGVGDFVARVALPPLAKLSEPDAAKEIQHGALGGLALMLRSYEPDDPVRKQVIATALKFARHLHLAHLSTLASCYLQYLWRDFGNRDALWALVEVLLDVGADASQLPSRDDIVVKGTPEELDLVGYIYGRTSVRTEMEGLFINDINKAPPDYRSKPPAEIAKSFQRSHLVIAHAFLDRNEFPVPFEVINEVVRQDPMWRYAGAVRLAVLAAQPGGGDQFLKVLDNFVEAFGNEDSVWLDLDRHANADGSWRNGFSARLSRELNNLPHDRAAWAAMQSEFPDDEERWADAISARIAQQCTLD